MSRESGNSPDEQIRDVIARMQSRIPDLHTLLNLLAPPLDSLKLLPPRFVKYNISPLPRDVVYLPKHTPLLQRALLEHVLPAWGPMLDEENAYELAQQYFSPDIFLMSAPAAKDVALHAYATILALPVTDHSIRLLTALIKTYPIDVLWSATAGKRSREFHDKKSITWEDCVRNVAAVPGKVANALIGKSATIPPELEQGIYFDNISKRCEILISSLPPHPSQDDLSSITYLLTKLVNVGVFPATPPTWHSQASFFQATLPIIRSKLSFSAYAATWQQLFSAFPSTVTLHTVLTSLFAHIATVDDLDGSPKNRALVKREARLLRELLGPLRKDGDLFDAFVGTVLGRHWSVGHARIYACWVAGAEKGTVDKEGLELLLNNAIDVWTAPDHIKHSLLSGHRYFTALVLLTLSYFISGGSTSAQVTSLAMSPAFVKSITTYISHLDPSVRRCGMLVAEEVARASGKTLDFGDWDGDADGNDWGRRLRQLIRERDADANAELAEPQDAEQPDVVKADLGEEPAVEIVSPATVRAAPTARKPVIETIASGYDSDDSLTGYASEPSSSRSPSPTPSELEEIEKDPTLRVTQKKIARPVYLVQLGEMIRPTNVVGKEDEDEPKRIEVAMDVAEELIRRKKAYGTELEENAVNLVFGLIALNNNYELEGFEEKRQAALTALVACCPRKAAPAIIEEFFKHQYSTDHRFAMLNALALGARELASLPVPPHASKARPERITFPSKRLPLTLHERYLTLGDHLNSQNPVQNLLEGISQKAIESSRADAEGKVPEYVRERQLRLKRPAKVSEVTSSGLSRELQSMQLKPQPAVQFTDVAAEYFICPLINRFWLYLRNEQIREERTSHLEAIHRYKGAGTGLILNALTLSHFMATLAVLVHAAHNAKEWLAIIAPDALELAVTVGTRPVSKGEGREDDVGDEGNPMERQAKKEAAVLTACLELAIVVIDGCLEIDNGKTLGLEHTALVLAAGEWGAEVLSRLEKGAKMLGGGGMQEMKIQRAAAGLVLKVDELSSRWRASMVDMGF